MQTTPRTFSHIGLSVPDLDAAVRFYAEVLGLYVLMPPSEIVEDDSAIGQMCTDVFGPGWGRLRIAHLATGDGIGVELFEFEGHHPPEDNFAFRRHGTFHFAIQDPDLEGLRRGSSRQGASNACRCATISPGKSPIAWSMWKIRSGMFSRSTATAMS